MIALLDACFTLGATLVVRIVDNGTPWTVFIPIACVVFKVDLIFQIGKQ